MLLGKKTIPNEGHHCPRAAFAYDVQSNTPACEEDGPMSSLLYYGRIVLRI